MNDKMFIPADASHEQIEIIVGALYMTLGFALRHVGKVEGQASAQALKNELIAALKKGDISMSLLDDAATFDFVVSLIDGMKLNKA
jgi:hypothetical protein